MNRTIISGLDRPIEGSVTLSGAKNSALKVLTASILAQDVVVLDNIPLNMKDVQIKLQMIGAIGANISEDRPGRVKIKWPEEGPESHVPGDFGSVRTSLLFLGALLARTRSASIPLPAGCRIGERKHDLHLMALKKLGAVFCETTDRIDARADTLQGTTIEFPLRTTGGTENAILAGTGALGRTRLYNAHTRPEVIDLIEFLNKLGARINIPGSGLIEIEGVNGLGGGHHAIICDNMEAMTFSAFAALTEGKLRIRYFPEQDLEVPMIYLRESGCRFTRQGDAMIVERPDLLAPFDLSTGTFPGINSDMQPLFAVMATQAEGQSRITDIRFERRFQYVHELRKMGANITVDGNTIIVRGPTALHGAHVTATDLRGGAALAAAALVAEGQTVIEHSEQIDRGYDSFDEKLSALGVNIQRQE
jgi:UDP-N-acetylglucosamine 1-carboxyvinyltransferase